MTSSAFELEASGGSAQIDLRTFDLVIDGSITDGNGRAERHVSFNVYRLLQARYAADGIAADETTLVNEALQLLADFKMIRNAVAHS